METALLNTVISITIVFVALIFISYCIYLLGFVNKIENMLNNKNKKVDINSTTVSTKKIEEVPLSKKDDTELIAVIVAAISATMSETSGQVIPTDGLIIRSIKKRRA